MACGFCTVARQYGYNLLLGLDLGLNTLLAGDPHESVSQRTDRARTAGSKPAAAFCAVLTWVSNKILGNTGDHCTWANSPEAQDADEIWHWSPPA